MPAHAASIVGVVCIASASSPVPGCPATPPTLQGTAPSLQFRVGIFIANSAPLNGFDITILTNSTVLKPADAVLGTVQLGGTPTTISKCIGGVQKVGSAGCPAYDNASTLEYSVTGSLTPSAEETDLLFTAVYNVTANNPNSPMIFLTGCTKTSVAGGVCISISNGTTSLVPETSLNAKFSNSPPYFDIEANTGLLRVSEGDTDSSAFLTLTSLNGFGGTGGTTVNLAATSPPSGPTVSLSVPSVTLTAGAPGNQTFPGIIVNVATTVLPGNYTITFTGTSAGLPPNSITIIVEVPVPDFSLTIRNTAITFNVTASGTSQVSVSSTGNFNGTVTLTISAPPQLNGTFSNGQITQTLHLNKKGTNSTTLTVSSKIAGGYTLNITGTSTSGTHIATAQVLVLDYFLQTPAGALSVILGQNNVEGVTAASTGNYNTTVTIGTIYVNEITGNGIIGPSTGVNVGCSPNKLTLTSGGTFHGLNSTNCQVTGVLAGNYLVTVTATSGVGNRTSNHAVSFQVSVNAPSFSVILPKLTTVPVGQSTTVVAKIVSNAGLVDDVNMTTPTISAPGLSPPPSAALNASIVTIHLTNSVHNGTVLVTITAGSNTPAGTYNMTIFGTAKLSNPTSISGSMLVIVEAVASPHNLGVVSVTPSKTSATVGSPISIAIEIQNFGKLPENATIVAIVGDLSIGTNQTSIAAGDTYNTTITWNTAGFGPGTYVLGAKVLAVRGQTNTTFSIIRFATPITLTAQSTGLPSYITYLIIAAVIIIAVLMISVLFLSKRKKTAAV